MKCEREIPALLQSSGSSREPRSFRSRSGSSEVEVGLRLLLTHSCKTSGPVRHSLYCCSAARRLICSCIASVPWAVMG
jgi:hypothetical protein